MEEYEKLLSILRNSKLEHSEEAQNGTISPDIMLKTKERTMRYLRHRELVLEHSSASSIVIM